MWEGRAPAHLGEGLDFAWQPLANGLTLSVPIQPRFQKSVVEGWNGITLYLRATIAHKGCQSKGKTLGIYLNPGKEFDSLSKRLENLREDQGQVREDG